MALTIDYPPALPVSARKDEIKDAIANHQVVVVAGQTGSGKTTQIPKMCLELEHEGRLPDSKNSEKKAIIGHTQPRRIAAQTVAERIAEELNVPLGQEVGYQVRFIHKANPKTALKVMTDGVLLNEIQKDRLLRRYSVLIIDEAHERSLNIDFLLGYLKQILPERPDLKVVITSATIDSAKFVNFFGTRSAEETARSSALSEVPVLEVEGRTYPVEIRYQPVEKNNIPEKYTSQSDSLKTQGKKAPNSSSQKQDPREHRTKKSTPHDQSEKEMALTIAETSEGLLQETHGDVLVFLPSERDINQSQKHIQQYFQRSGRSVEILPLYGRLSLDDQHKIFNPVPGKRRIILSTNVAETSVTVPNITSVIDTGLARISRYSPRSKIQRLPIEEISQASAAQRAGRCGRVSEGICVRLYSEENFNNRPEYTDPEILRTNLAGVILSMASSGLADSVEHLRAFDFIDRPHERSITDGVNALKEIGALEGLELTDKGRKISSLPLDPRIAAILLEATRRGVTAEALVIAAALSIGDPRLRPLENAEKADSFHKRFDDKDSDFSTLIHVWNYSIKKQGELSKSAFKRLCKEEFLSYLKIKQWQELYDQLRQSSPEFSESSPPLKAFFEKTELKNPKENYEALHKSILSGYLWHIGMKVEPTAASTDTAGAKKQSKKRFSSFYRGPRNSQFNIFPGSGIFNTKPEWIVAAEMVETSQLWARTAAGINPAWIEDVAKEQKLVTYSYSEPHWSKKAGSVRAFEKASLWSLPLISRRPVQYGSIDPVVSREIFIQSALVEGRWRPFHKFWKNNRALLKKLEEREERTGQRGLKVDDQTIYEFYDEKIPPSVVSARHFDNWWKRVRHKTPDLLNFTEEFLSTDAHDGINLENFPRLWDDRLPGQSDEQTHQFELNYSYDEGVTVRIPLALLDTIDDEQFQWHVAGMRKDRIEAIIKSLPKSERKNFVPAPDTAAQAAQKLAENYSTEENFLDSLRWVLLELKSHSFNADAIDWSAISDRLKMSFDIIDERQKSIPVPEKFAQDPGISKNLKQLKNAYKPLVENKLGLLPASEGSVTQATLSDVSSSQADKKLTPAQEDLPKKQLHITSWDVSELTDTIDQAMTTVVGSHEVQAYPALVDNITSVGYKLFIDQQSAKMEHQRGITRLMFLDVLDTNRGIVDYVKQHMSLSEHMIVLNNSFVTGLLSAQGSAQLSTDQRVIEEIMYATVKKLFDPAIYHKHEFDDTRERLRGEIIDETFVTLGQLASIFEAEAAVQESLDSPVFSDSTIPEVCQAVEDIEEQLRQLFYPGFISDSDSWALNRLPVYLKAIEKRLQKLLNNPVKDAESTAVIQDLEDQYDQMHHNVSPQKTEQLEKVRWMLEELRVSLFAQELGTAYKISPTRITTALNQL